VAVVIGLVLLFMQRLENPYSAVTYIVVMGILVWNRIDSRGKAYKFSVKGPGGTEVKLEAKNDSKTN
jgi:hypothetical protein